jgi:lysophospholipase L1-like esterase
VPGRDRLTVVEKKRITISEDRFRYPTKLGRKGPGEVRVFTFGDSVSMGWGVDDQSHYSALAENMLNAGECSGARFRVIAAGVNAYPNSLVAKRVSVVFDQGYEPDIVVLAYSFNTAFEGMADLTGAERTNFMKRVSLKRALRRSALYNFVIEDVLRNLVYYQIRTLFVPGTWQTGASIPNARDPAFQRRLEAVERLCQQRRARLVLLLLGSTNQKTELHPFQQQMLEFGRSRQLPVVNMIDALRGEDHSKLFMDHVHPNAQGHLRIASELANTVRRLVPECRVSGQAPSAP